MPEKKHPPEYWNPPVIDRLCPDKLQYQNHKFKNCNSCTPCKVPKKMVDACVILAAVLEEQNSVNAGKLLEKANDDFHGSVTKEIFGEILKRLCKEWRNMNQNINTLQRAVEVFMSRCRAFTVIEPGEDALKLSIFMQEFATSNGNYLDAADTRHIATAITNKLDFITQDDRSIVKQEALIRAAVKEYDRLNDTQFEKNINIIPLSKYK